MKKAIDTVPIEVLWAANSEGYTVVALRHGAWIEEYDAGNSPNDSTAHETDPRYAVPVKTLRKYARSTAKEIAEELKAQRPNAPITIDEEPELLVA